MQGPHGRRRGRAHRRRHDGSPAPRRRDRGAAVSELAHLETQPGRRDAAAPPSSARSTCPTPVRCSTRSLPRCPTTPRSSCSTSPQTTYLDSAGIAGLFRLAERLRIRRQDLRLVVPPDSPIRAVLRLTHLDHVIQVDDTPPGRVGAPRARARLTAYGPRVGRRASPLGYAVRLAHRVRGRRRGGEVGAVAEALEPARRAARAPGRRHGCARRGRRGRRRSSTSLGCTSSGRVCHPPTPPWHPTSSSKAATSSSTGS